MLDEQHEVRETAPAPVFYRLDYSRVTLREQMAGQPAAMLPLMALFRLLRATTHASTDEPPVGDMQPFAVDALPAEVQGLFAPAAQELETLGFREPVYHMVIDSLHSSRTYWATYRHESGQALARIHYRVWSLTTPPRIRFFPMFITELDGGAFLTSSAGDLDLLAPPAWQADYYTKQPTATVWAAHQQALNAATQLPQAVPDREAMRGVIERHHGGQRDFHLARGVFKPLSAVEQEINTTDLEALNPEDQAVLAQLYRRTPEQPASKWRPLIILGISLLLFVLASFTQEKGYARFLLLAIPILFIHELGHYLAMKLFGYRNLRMFFIPLLGAAVTGQHFNVPGWKKAVISLAGPVPGILLGFALFFVSLALNHRELGAAAVIFIILNGFNLLPVMPLDGGWLAHTLFFSRNPYLDIAFRVLAIIAILASCLLPGMRYLFILAIPMATGLPLQWRMATIARRLRNSPDLAISPDDRSIPVETAKAILAELRKAQVNTTAPVMAQQITGIFELLNARPPGIAATLGFGAVHLACLLATAAFTLAFIFPTRSILPRNSRSQDKPLYRYERGTTQAWQGTAAQALPLDKRAMIYATCRNTESAERTFTGLRHDLSDQAAVRLFGQSLIISLPETDTTTRNRLRQRLQSVTRDVLVTHNTLRSRPPVQITCLASGEAEAERLRQELEPCFSGGEFYQVHLFSPWSPRWQALSPSEQQRYLTARRTYMRLYRQPGVIHRRQAYRQLFDRQIELYRDGKDEVAEKLQAKIDAMFEQEFTQFVAGLRAEGPAGVDVTLVDLWEQRRRLGLENRDIALTEGEAPSVTARREAYNRKREELEQAMSARLGRHPAGFSTEEDPYHVQMGSLNSSGRRLSFSYFSFPDITVGLPAFAEWLYDQGCTDVRYRIMNLHRR